MKRRRDSGHVSAALSEALIQARTTTETTSPGSWGLGYTPGQEAVPTDLFTGQKASPLGLLGNYNSKYSPLGRDLELFLPQPSRPLSLGLRGRSQ